MTSIFDEYIFWQARDFNGGTRRQPDAFRRKIFCVDGIHRGEIIEVFEEDGCLDDALEGASAGVENGFEVLEDLSGLLDYSAGDYLLRLRIERDLPSGEEQATHTYSLRVGADGGGSFVLETIVFAR